jgi:hypothetical protein
MYKLFMSGIFLILCGSMFFTSELKANSGCDNVSGEGHTRAVNQNTFQGTAVFKINDQTVSATVTTVLLGPPRATEDGTLHAATSHTFVFPNGSSITTRDNAVLSPTETQGLYRLNTRATISGGTGIYANACGALNVHGTINLISGEVNWNFTGRVCDCR